MAIPWGTIKSLLLFFGPLLLPKAIAYYRSVRAAPLIQGVPIRPIPSSASRALLILFITSLVFLFKTLSFASPENIFALTSSRLQIPTDVLFTRLLPLRPTGFTPSDEILRSRIGSLESRLLFFQFGPDVIINCTFCNPEDPKSYFYYALPALLAPHLLNLVVLASVTSGLFTGKYGAVWRNQATMAAAAAGLLDVYMVSSYNYQGNAAATRLEDIDAFFWKARVYRGIVIAGLDGLLGWVIYLSSTNRAFLTPPSTAERLETSTRLLESVRSKMGAVGIMRNTTLRDEGLRAKIDDYWVQEGKHRREIFEDRDVIQARNNALHNRIDIDTITSNATEYANSIVKPVEIAFPGGI